MNEADTAVQVLSEVIVKLRYEKAQMHDMLAKAKGLLDVKTSEAEKLKQRIAQLEAPAKDAGAGDDAPQGN